MNVKEVALNVGVSPEELIEILNDIDISVNDIDTKLELDQIEKVCDELGYSSLEEASKDNISKPKDEEPKDEEPKDEEPKDEEPKDEEPKDEEPKDELKKIIELKKTKVAVKEFAELLNLNDFIYDLAITANRPDGMSVIGIAREISALLETKLHFPELNHKYKVHYYYSPCFNNV